MSDKVEIPPPPPTMAASPLAIDRLTAAVENLRADIAAQGAMQNLKLTTVLDAIARFDATLKTLSHDHMVLKRSHIELAERVEKLESHAFRKLSRAPKPKKKGRRAAKKS